MAAQTTVIGPGIRFVGDVAGDGDVEVHGRLEGAVHIGGELRVGRGGIAAADVVAARVRIDGRLEGRVRATKQVSIGPQGCLVGDVQGLLSVDEGGIFAGRVEVDLTEPGSRRPDESGTNVPTPPAAPVRTPEPRTRTPHRLLTPAAPVLKVKKRKRTPTTPSAGRSIGEVSGEQLPKRTAPRRLVRTDDQLVSVTTRPMPKVQAEEPRTRTPRAAVTPPPPVPVQLQGPTPVRGMTAVPSTLHKRRLRKGDAVPETTDLSEEWFEEEDYLLQTE